MTELIEDSILKRILGNSDGMGTSYKDFIVLPGRTREKHIPENIDISTDLAGVKLYTPFIAAAMQSVVNKEFALEASKKMMAVAPRGLPIDEQVAIVDFVRTNEVPKDEIEYQANPVRVAADKTLGIAIAKAMEYGHSHIPVVDKFQHYKGMYIYKPIEHDRADPNTPIAKMMMRFTKQKAPFCRTTTNEEDLKKYMRERKLRMVPVLDSENRLRRLVFLQERKAYRVGGAIDTKDWKARARELVDAGADMIFTDTSDGHSDFEIKVVEKYKEIFPDGPPICAGNMVTPEGFRDLAEAGADAVKLNMGTGSICTTNKVFGVGGPPMWTLINVAIERLKYLNKTGKYIPLISDGGMEDMYDVDVALFSGDAVMSGKLFAPFDESAGELSIDEKTNKRYKIYYGEASEEAVMRSGHTGRYFGTARSFVIQGVKSRVPLVGKFKPGLEGYANTLKQALCHAGCSNLEEYRNNARLLRLTEASKYTAMPHGVEVVD